MLLHDQLPDYTDQFEQQQLILDRGFWFLRADSKIGEQSFPNQFLIHSGYGGNILYDDDFAKKYRLGQYLPIVEESELKDSYGNVLKTKKAKLPGLTIGKSTINELSVSFFEGAIGRQKMSVMGGGVLRRFHWIFDLEAATVYVQAISG